MDKRLRHRILSKLAQTAPATPNAAPAATLGPPPAVPGELLSTLTKGYNGPTVQAITRLTNDLNGALHYASDGKGNMDKIRTNSYDTSGASPDALKTAVLTRSLFFSFLNGGKPIEGERQPNQIKAWADTLVSQTNGLTQTGAGSKLNQLLQSSSGVGNLKDAVMKEVNAITAANPFKG